MPEESPGVRPAADEIHGDLEALEARAKP